MTYSQGERDVETSVNHNKKETNICKVPTWRHRVQLNVNRILITTTIRRKITWMTGDHIEEVTSQKSWENILNTYFQEVYKNYDQVTIYVSRPIKGDQTLNGKVKNLSQKVSQVE